MPKKKEKKPHAVKNCGFLKIFPSLKKDTLNGKPITNSVMWMSYTTGTATVCHKGKNVEIDISAGLDGTTILSLGGRTAKTTLKAIIDKAIENGFLDDKIDFTETE